MEQDLLLLILLFRKESKEKEINPNSCFSSTDESHVSRLRTDGCNYTCCVFVQFMKKNLVVSLGAKINRFVRTWSYKNILVFFLRGPVTWWICHIVFCNALYFFIVHLITCAEDCCVVNASNGYPKVLCSRSDPLYIQKLQSICSNTLNLLGCTLLNLSSPHTTFVSMYVQDWYAWLKLLLGLLF